MIGKEAASKSEAVLIFLNQTYFFSLS